MPLDFLYHAWFYNFFPSSPVFPFWLSHSLPSLFYTASPQQREERRTEELVRHLPSPLFTLQSSNSAGVFTGEGRNQAWQVQTRLLAWMKWVSRIQFFCKALRMVRISAKTDQRPQSWGSCPIPSWRLAPCGWKSPCRSRGPGRSWTRSPGSPNMDFFLICNSAEIGLQVSPITCPL